MRIATLSKDFGKALKQEFRGYNGKKLSQDLLAGVTVAAVALPLALAFGVSSGATAAAGLITAILAGVLIGGLSGASYQISGPTGAMAAVLGALIAEFGLKGMFLACFLSGIILIFCGLFKVGGLVSFIPLPVITGFTSGIAIIIAFGQIGNLTGLVCEGESTLQKAASYFRLPQSLDVTALLIGLAVIVFMALYPKKLNQYVPSSLASIVLALIVNLIADLPVGVVGDIPKTLFLSDRLHASDLDLSTMKGVLFPAISIAALGLIESLLCGASAGRMKNESWTRS